MSINHKKVGVATNVIINPRKERNKIRRNKQIRKSNNCNLCNYYIKDIRTYNKFNFTISSIAIELNCKEYTKKEKKQSEYSDCFIL